MVLDYDPNVVVIVKTDDLLFTDVEVSMTVRIDDDSIDTQPLILDIKFVSPPP